METIANWTLDLISDLGPSLIPTALPLLNFIGRTNEVTEKFKHGWPSGELMEVVRKVSGCVKLPDSECALF